MPSDPALPGKHGNQIFDTGGYSRGVDDSRFINRPMSTVLDAVRFVSAFLVMTCHMVGPTGYPVPGSATPRLSHYCVIVFFVLSGLVIDASVSERRTDLKAYATARISRIMAVAMPAILFSGLVCWWIASSAGPLPDGFAANVLGSSAKALLFLNETSYGGATITNPAYWSLCYEVWYYALFGAAVFLKGPLRWLVLAAMAWVAGFKILLLLPVWLGGVWLNRSKAARAIPLERAFPVLLACAVGLYAITLWDAQVLLWLRDALQPISLGMSEWLASDYVAGLFFIGALAALRPLAGQFADAIERVSAPVKYLAGFSFTLYLFHPPLAAAMAHLGWAQSATFGEFALFVTFILGACAAIASITERQAPVLRKAMLALFDRQRATVPALH